MRTLLSMALMAMLLSDTILALHLHGKRTVTIEACEATNSVGQSAITQPSNFAVASASGVLSAENSNGEADAPANVASTALVVSVPVETVSNSIQTGSGLPSAFSYPEGTSGNGMGAARPTGLVNNTRNSSHHHSHNSTTITSKPSSVKISTNVTQPTFSLTDSLSQKTSQTTAFMNSSKTSTKAGFSTGKSSKSTAATAKPSTTGINSGNSSSSARPSMTSISSFKTVSTTALSTPSTSAVSKIPFLRGVNLGGWLVVEAWMNTDLFNGSFSSAVDEWTLSSMSGAQAALQKHWSTFITESDIASIAATGINALRIPIGFWAYDNANTPYIQGQDAYLEKAIGWARSHNMSVWIDCHGSPGSQNGFDNSGHAGEVNWQHQDNLNRSISVLKTMAAKYGSEKYEDVVVGLELTNEPISYGNNNFSVTKEWAQEAYAAVKEELKNEKIVVVMHDAFKGASEWIGVAKKLLGTGSKTFGIDSHLYQLFTQSSNSLTQSEHITEACGWEAQLAVGNAVMPTYVGEWSAATNICVNPDGSTTAGTSCSTSGCQCESADFDDWNKNMVEQVRRFVEAQMDVFEKSSSGYFMWAAKGPGAWGFLNGIQKGVVPNPVTSRKYPGQCGN